MDADIEKMTNEKTAVIKNLFNTAYYGARYKLPFRHDQLPPPGGVPVADHPYAEQTKSVKTSSSHMMVLWPQPVTGQAGGH